MQQQRPDNIRSRVRDSLPGWLRRLTTRGASTGTEGPANAGPPSRFRQWLKKAFSRERPRETVAAESSRYVPRINVESPARPADTRRRPLPTLVIPEDEGVFRSSDLHASAGSSEFPVSPMVFGSSPYKGRSKVPMPLREQLGRLPWELPTLTGPTGEPVRVTRGSGTAKQLQQAMTQYETSRQAYETHHKDYLDRCKAWGEGSADEQLSNAVTNIRGALVKYFKAAHDHWTAVEGAFDLYVRSGSRGSEAPLHVESFRRSLAKGRDVFLEHKANVDEIELLLKDVQLSEAQRFRSPPERDAASVASTPTDARGAWSRRYGESSSSPASPVAPISTAQPPRTPPRRSRPMG
jgi:hypothetical protein